MSEEKVEVRKHRLAQPWRDGETGAVVELTARERAEMTRSAALRALVQTLSADDAFLGAVARVRAGEQSAESAARPYARGGGYPLRVMQRVIQAAADSPVKALPYAVAGIGTLAVRARYATVEAERLNELKEEDWQDFTLLPDDPKQWIHAKGWHAATKKLARLGAGGASSAARPSRVTVGGDAAPPTSPAGSSVPRSSGATGRRSWRCSIGPEISSGSSDKPRETQGKNGSPFQRCLTVSSGPICA
jgi:hypothetical protein